MRICSLKSGCQLICQIDTIDTRCRSVIRSGLQKGPLSRQMPCVNTRHTPLWMQASRRCIRCLGERSPVLLMLGRRSAGDRPLAIGGCPHLPGTAVSLSRGWGSADPPSLLLRHYLRVQHLPMTRSSSLRYQSWHSG